MIRKTWNPYLSGALTGVLLIISVAAVDQFLGASTTFARAAALVERAAGIDTDQLAYFSEKGGKYGPNSLPNWQLLFVTGVMIGGFVSSRLSGTFSIQFVPDMWARRFGPNPIKRGAVAFAGGAILIIGARLAGGCPSGHGLSGLSQLAVSGFIALACFFAGGLITASVLYKE